MSKLIMWVILMLNYHCVVSFVCCDSYGACSDSFGTCGVYRVCTGWSVAYGCFCTPCPVNKYCPGDGASYDCSVTCPNGKFKPWNNMPCNACSDLECSECPTGYWCANNTIRNCSVCGANQVSLPCRRDADTVCINCKTNCDVDEYMYKPCTATSDMVCYKCPANSVLKPNGTSYMDCVCAPGWFGKVTGINTSTCAPCPSNMFCSQEAIITCPK